MAKIKGTAVRSSLDLMKESHGEPGLQEALALLPPDDKALLCSAGIDTQWVSMDVYARWLEASVEVACNGDERGIVPRAARGIASQLKGVYRVFAYLASPEAVLKKLMVIDRTYFDGVRTTLREQGPRRWVIEYHGFEKQHWLFDYVLLGWWSKILETTRAKSPRVRILTSIAEGKDHSAISIEWD